MTTYPLLGLAPGMVLVILGYAIGCVVADVWRAAAVADTADIDDEEFVDET